MIVRAIDGQGDWLFGKGKNDYKSGNNAISQNIQTRLLSFLGDCFFDLNAGIDWWNRLGAKDKTALNLDVSSVILNTAGVTGLLQLSITLDAQRVLTITYRVQTIYSTTGNTFQYALSGTL